jgi:general secretion pathway protein L
MQVAMTIQQILNADLSTIARWCRDGLAWWLEELADAIPVRWRSGARRHAPWTARIGDDGAMRLWRDGSRVLSEARPGSSPRRADLLLQADAVLVRRIDLPPLSSRDLRRMLTENMDRLTPFPADRVYFEVSTEGESDREGRRRLRLAVILREQAHAALEQARALGLEVERLGVETENGDVDVDFMVPIRAEQGGARDLRRPIWWSACAGLVALNVATAVFMDIRDVRRLEAAVAAEQPKVAAAGKLRQAVANGQRMRLDVLSRRSRNEPLRIIDALSKVLPDGQWVHRLEWNGRAVRIAGFKTQGFDVPAALRQTPALTDPRSLLSDMPVRTASGVEPFDVIADSTAKGGQ